MSAFEQKYQGKIKFIHINVEATEGQAILTKYNVRGTPTIVLLDKYGRVVANSPGWVSDEAAADALVKLAALQ